ncbi:MAG: hypothetical protein QW692_00815 [Nitrososphaerota archaeon]
MFDSVPRLAAHISNHHSLKRGQGEIIGLLRQLLEEDGRARGFLSASKREARIDIMPSLLSKVVYCY